MGSFEMHGTAGSRAAGIEGRHACSVRGVLALVVFMLALPAEAQSSLASEATRDQTLPIPAALAVQEQPLLLEEPIDFDAEAATEHAERRRRRVLAAAISLGTLGVLSASLAGWRFALRVDDGAHLRASPASVAPALHAWQVARWEPWALGSIASALGTLSAAMITPYVPDELRTWLTPLSVAVASTLLVAGTVQLVQGGGCPEAESAHAGLACMLRHERRDRGALLLLGALPFLALPLGHLRGWATSVRIPTDLALTASTRELTLSVRF